MLEKGKKVGEYVLLEKLGAGGFGDVWRAEKRTALDVNHFALKFFRPKEDGVDFDKIGKELAVWKQLKGLPHIISVIELDRFEDYVYVVSDYADGGSLEKWLKTNGGKASSEAEAVKIAQEILTGLENLHGKGFVHRDLKPDNILIMNGKFCLADFGISREIKTHSKATGTAGTMEYMPPEAFEKSPSVTPQTDIWAVGVILQRLLTGALPYPQEDYPALVSAILMYEPEEMPETVSPNLRSIVKKALQKKHESRFQTADEMREVLRDILKNPPKFISNQATLQARTLLLEDSDKTAKLEIEQTKDWREIEAEKERQRKLSEAQKLKESEESQRLKEVEAKRQQAEKERLEREKEERDHRERNKNQRSAKIRRLLLGIGAVILSPFIISFLMTKPWETNNQLIDNKSAKQFVNNAANKASNTFSNQPVNIPTNVSNTPINTALENSSQINKSQNANPTLSKKSTPSNLVQSPTPVQSPQTSTSEISYYCGAQTKSGKMCPRRVKGGGRCWQHIGQPALLPQEKLKVS